MSASWKIQIERKARKSLARLPESLRGRIDAAIRRLASAPYSGDPLMGNLKGSWKTRVGSYRVLYDIHDSALLVVVFRVAHRNVAYRDVREEIAPYVAERQADWWGVPGGVSVEMAAQIQDPLALPVASC